MDPMGYKPSIFGYPPILGTPHWVPRLIHWWITVVLLETTKTGGGTVDFVKPIVNVLFFRCTHMSSKSSFVLQLNYRIVIWPGIVWCPNCRRGLPRGTRTAEGNGQQMVDLHAKQTCLCHTMQIYCRAYSVEKICIHRVNVLEIVFGRYTLTKRASQLKRVNLNGTNICWNPCFLREMPLVLCYSCHS